MRYTPPKNQTAKIFSLLAMLCATLLLGTVLLSVPYKALWELIAMLFLIASFELLYRYNLTTFTYELEGENFAVIRKTGRKTVTVCNISLRTGKELSPAPRSSAEKKARLSRLGTPVTKYNFCQTVCPKNAYLYRFTFNDAEGEIAFEPSVDFAGEMQARLDTVRDLDDA